MVIPSRKIIVGLAQLILSSRIRGSNRLVRLFAHYVPVLQKIPITISDNTIFLDLKINTAHSLLLNPVATEPELEILKKLVKPNDIVYDIDAHIGLYTISLSNLVGSKGTVYSFEPNSSVLPALRKTISNLKNVKLLELVLSKKKGSEVLAVARRSFDG